jgi:YVTN family beta-propeller protein
MKWIWVAIALICSIGCCFSQKGKSLPYLHAPTINEYAKHDPNGVTILPSGRLIKPYGRCSPVAQWPHGLVVSPDGTAVFVASAGVGQVITGWQTDSPAMKELVPGQRRDSDNSGAAAFSPDGRTLYWSSGESGGVYFYDIESGQKITMVSLNGDLNGRTFKDSFVMDVQLSPDGKYLYCADVANFRVAVVDTVQKKMIGSVQVGRYPYALTVAGNRVYVANIGMFEYVPIPPPSDSQFDPRGLTFPPYGFPSKESREGVFFEGRQIPGLGDPNVSESFSVWGLDVSNPRNPRVVKKIKTGIRVGDPSDQEETVGGSAPNFVAVQGRFLYVSNNNNDLIEKIDLQTHKIVAKRRVVPSPLVAKLRGVGPAGMVVSRDGKRLYLAETGINAIAVLDTQNLKVLGHIPTAWYPYRVALSRDGRNLFVICFKGFGNGPSGGTNRPDSPYLGMKGVFTVIKLPPERDLTMLTQNVLKYNGIVDRSADRKKMASPVIPTTPGTKSSQIKYVVFITKENHTFDTIFDRVPGAKHDPNLLRWGLHQRIAAEGQPVLEDVAVMTNHNALARQFTVSDNFYLEPEFSGVGHRWLVGVQPNNWCQMTYTLGWNFIAFSSAPGRRASFGSNGGLMPEDYPEAGAMWEHLARHRVKFRNYGEGFEFPGVDEGEHAGKTGAREVVNVPMSKALYDNTSREFPIFNMNIPDQYRADWFIEEFTRLYLKNKKPVPSFINIAICNDHGAGPRPDRGYPYVASWMADNDLALGRIVEFLSHTPFWKNMAIFVLEDDSGGEPDHIDAQRSVMLVISPWVKRGYVSHRHTTVVSIHRTLYQIFGLPPLNMFDALANDFSDCFTTKPDFRPYKVVPVDKRIFDPEKAKDRNDPFYKKARLMPSIPMDNPEVMEDILKMAEEEQRIKRK